jgi:uncharacterized protein (DUF427 family)
MKAIWNGTVLAESADTVVVESNHYFPRESLVEKHFQDNPQRSVCGWKGEAHYLDILVGDSINRAAAWQYPDPKPKAAAIRGHVAFWKGVRVTP